MPRPYCKRKVRHNPDATYFKPAGIPLKELEEVTLYLDELEALRLSDAKKLGQVESAQKMEISQPTFHRLLASARNKVAEALSTGKAIRVIKR